MDMQIIKSEKKLCPCCMQEHEVKTVVVIEDTTFKDKEVSYEATYSFCDRAQEFFSNEVQTKNNDVRMKDAYRKKSGLLTSTEICNIRSKYEISQNDLCELLGWGSKTITRYESHQVQDRAHDTILKKINEDPEWFISLLKKEKDKLPAESYSKYLRIATALYGEEREMYLRKAVEAICLSSKDDSKIAEALFEKIIDAVKTSKRSAENQRANFR